MGTGTQVGTVQLWGLCHSGAQSKPCTSAPLSIPWSQRNEAKSRCFAFKQAGLRPRAAHKEHALLVLTCCEHHGDVQGPLSQHGSQRAEHCAGLLFQKIFPVVQWWILLSQLRSVMGVFGVSLWLTSPDPSWAAVCFADTA